MKVSKYFPALLILFFSGVVLCENKNFQTFQNCLETFLTSDDGSLVTHPYIYGSPPRNINMQSNTRLPQINPLAYFIPLKTTGVQTVVKCGVKTGVKLIPNSGGHSYEDISWGDNNTVVVDFREMGNVRVEGEERNAIAVIQPGALLGKVHAQLWEIGKYGIPVGTCYTVGIGGHFIGGGIGMFSPLYGLLLDNVVEVEMVDARGDILTGSASRNPELFWALRGSGPGYIGIATLIKVKTFQADKAEFTVVRAHYPVKDFATVYAALDKWTEWAVKSAPSTAILAVMYPENWTSSYPTGIGGLVITTTFTKDPEINPELDEAVFLKKFDETFPPGNRVIVKPTYFQYLVGTGYAPIRIPLFDPRLNPSNNNLGVISPPFPPRNLSMGPLGVAFLTFSDEDILERFMLLEKDLVQPRYFKSKCIFIKRAATENERLKLAELMARAPSNRVNLIITGEIGAIQEVPWHATAYSHRDSLLDFCAHVEAVPEDGDVSEAMSWLEEFYAAMLPLDSGETYQNYPDLDIKNYPQRFYGRNLPRLITAKRTWDPLNYFQNPLSIPTQFFN